MQAWAPKFDHQLRGDVVKRGHGSCGRFRASGRGTADLGGKGHDSGAQGLGQNKPIARPGPGIGYDLVGVNKAGYRESGLNLFVVDAMPSDHGHAGLGHFIHSAAKNLVHGFVGHGCGWENPRLKGP